MMATINLYSKEQTDALLANKADNADVYTKTEVDNALTSKADASTTYTKTEVDNALAGKVDNATLDNYATKTYVNSKRTTEIVVEPTFAEFLAKIRTLSPGDQIISTNDIIDGTSAIANLNVTVGRTDASSTAFTGSYRVNNNGVFYPGGSYFVITDSGMQFRSVENGANNLVSFNSATVQIGTMLFIKYT